jgi:DNA-binding PadR family transcriptional regulator
MREGRGRGGRHFEHRYERGGWGPPGRRDGRRRRGDIRTALLAALAEGPGHGYELMQRIEDKSDGAWRPSPGSVYPSLQLLEDEGLVVSSERDGKRVYEITDAGREEAERRVEEAGGTPWAQGERGGSYGRLFGLLRQVALAARQVAKVGTPAQVEQAATIMDDARKRLYQLLITD